MSSAPEKPADASRTPGTPYHEQRSTVQRIVRQVHEAHVPYPHFLQHHGKKTATVIGAPMTYGQGKPGTDHGPGMIRDAGLISELRQLWWEVPSPANQRHSLPASLPYRSRTAATVIGAPMTYGQGKPGTDHGPGMIRDAGLISELRQLWWEVEDRGDLAFAP
eukprot:CAMPEP_0172206174 /NCGR_PEP_ID=MMETSP1050-20130122/33057_1 /TAXON_ID=233186 /ORGANISM="Cryptomonas curvata, Strain CCAP979/52" /LENGTH=162 /DNA_ID=CAMNT_0012885199 /DNA_START=76 /DNA_END=561 /DNA_ORIENTATION=-